MNYKIIEHSHSLFKDLPHLRYRASKSKKSIYVEPFLGSGAIFLNLPKKFDAYYLAEKNNDVYNMWYQIIHKTDRCGEFLVYAQYIDKNFGLYSELGYNDFVEYYATNLRGSNTREQAYAFILIALYGKPKQNKSNPSKRIVSEYEFKRIEHTISHLRGMKKKISIYRDYEDVLYIPYSLQVIHPPYYMDDHTSNYWYKRDTELLIKSIRPSSDVMYIDVKNPVADSELELTDFDDYTGDMISGFGTFTNITRLASQRNQYRMYRQPYEPDEYLYTNF